jgi:hypothetical protein
MVEQVTQRSLVIVQEEAEPVPPQVPTFVHVRVVVAVLAKVVAA